MTALRIALALAVVGVALAACGDATPSPTAAPAPTPSAAPTATLMSVVAWIGGHALTHAEFLDRRAIVAESVASMERDVYDIFPNPDSEIDRESYPILLKEWQVRIATMKKYGYDTVAFSELVHEYALVAAAIRDGHTVSSDETAAFIKEQSTNLDMALSDPEFKSEIEKSLADSGGREAFLE